MSHPRGGVRAETVKNPSGNPAGRTIVWKVIDKAGNSSVVGDPTVNGATLNIMLTPGGTQCVQLPAIDWDHLGTGGFKYNDSSRDHGPVQAAKIKRTPFLEN